MLVLSAVIVIDEEHSFSHPALGIYSPCAERQRWLALILQNRKLLNR
jgi:hypothetical protein